MQELQDETGWSPGSSCVVLDRYPLRKEDVGRECLRLLVAASRDQDEAVLGLGLDLASIFGPRGELVPELDRLGGQEWHARHMDVVGLLREVALPTCAGPLFRLAMHGPKYSEEDENFALRRSATFALGDVLTAEAMRLLRRVADCGVPVLSVAATEAMLRALKLGTQDVIAQSRAELAQLTPSLRCETFSTIVADRGRAWGWRLDGDWVVATIRGAGTALLLWPTAESAAWSAASGGWRGESVEIDAGELKAGGVGGLTAAVAFVEVFRVDPSAGEWVDLKSLGAAVLLARARFD